MLALMALVMWFAFPATSNRVILSVEAGFGKALSEVGLGGTASGGALELGPQQAHFTSIDGPVRVNKASTNTSVQADYSLAPEPKAAEVTRGPDLPPPGFQKFLFYTGFAGV